ncbi:hypothetical protein Tco_1080098 [Tanacetum coccineum]|uniref:Uncharacterized protein n=1 Tax=Tanacetum coccineum TaxID=301880 RepID=A0ABQ5HVP6_9ASTR
MVPRDSSVKPTTGCDKESDNSKENTNDSLKQQQKTDSKTSSVKEKNLKKARENNDAPIIEDWVSDDEDEVEPKFEKKTVIPTATKKELLNLKNQLRGQLGMQRCTCHKDLEETKGIGMVKNPIIGCRLCFNNKACFICGSFDHIEYSCPKTSHPSLHKHMAPRAVLLKTGLKFVNTARLVNTVRVLIVKPHNKTPYELFRGFKPAIGFMKPFGCHVTILNTLDKLGKFDGKSDEGYFVDIP